MLGNGLLKNGLYYEGIVSSVDDILELYERQAIKLHLPILGVKKKQQYTKYWLHNALHNMYHHKERSHSMKGCQSLQVTRK